jgi:hypothetical protein
MFSNFLVLDMSFNCVDLSCARGGANLGIDMNVVCLRLSIVVQNASIGTLESQTDWSRHATSMHRDCVSQPKVDGLRRLHT